MKWGRRRTNPKIAANTKPRVIEIAFFDILLVYFRAPLEDLSAKLVPTTGLEGGFSFIGGLATS
jgi:hypothetical protein